MRGIPKGEENVRLLEVYVAELAAIRRGLPSRDGRPNLSVIADACGFDRGVFYNNDAAKEVLKKALRRVGLDTGPPDEVPAFDRTRLREETKVRDDGKSKSLEEEVLRLRAENASLRAENARYRALRELLAETGRLP